MTVTYGEFNRSANAIVALSQTKIKDFKVRMKVARLKKWVGEITEELKEGYAAIEDKYEISPEEFNEDGNYIGKDKSGFVATMKAKGQEKKELEAIEIEVPDEIPFTETQLSALDPEKITGEVLTQLEILGMFILEKS